VTKATAGQTLQNDLGRRIQSLRLGRELTREVLAELTDMTPQNLLKVEAGDRFVSAESLQRLAKALGVPVFELFKFAADVPARAEALAR
jgi:transcriptional regulator with XRE-family HTH domain